MRPRIFCGCSGWYYGWNPELSLDWYLANSGLNAIELNASFYRFPFPNQVKSWAKKGQSLRWVVKVNRGITHRLKFGKGALDLFNAFRELFEPLEEHIDFYLFQLPPSMRPSFAPKIQAFVSKAKISEKAAIEVRNSEWFDARWLDWAKKAGLTWVSVDCPDLPRDVYKTTDTVYVRMHGRTFWYAHKYSQSELLEVAEKIYKAKPKKIYVFFNNDHDMLANARQMRSILEKKLL